MSYSPRELNRGYIDGLITANGSDSDHDIDIAPGSARDSSDSHDIKVNNAITKQIDNPWIAGTGVGGFPSNLTLTADTWYHMFTILNNNLITVDAGYDTSLIAANLKLDATTYTDFRRVASILVDDTVPPNIIGYSQLADEFLWNAAVLDYDVTNTVGTTAVPVTLASVPLGVQVGAIMNIDVTGVLNNGLLVSSLDTPDQAASLSAAPLFTTLDTAATNVAQLTIRTNTTQQVRLRASAGTFSTTKIATLGWNDPRGKDV